MKKKILISLSVLFIAVCSYCQNDTSYQKEKKKDTVKNLKYSNLRRNPLPFPGNLKDTVLPDRNILVKERDSLLAILQTISKQEALFGTDTIQKKKALLNKLLALNKCKIILWDARESQCGSTINWQDVERYDGSLGVTKEFVKDKSPKVGQLQWRYNFSDEFKNNNDNPGALMGTRWCTGTLIGKDIFITAGHCFDNNNPEYKDKLPVKNGKIISSRQMARLMKVNFNYELEAATTHIRTDTIDYPVLDTIEFRRGGYDYAIILLGKDKNGMLPGERFGIAQVSKEIPVVSDPIAVIQHPLGYPKVVAAGTVLSCNASKNENMDYNNLDTEGGASGAAVLSIKNGKIIGIHVLGGCNGDDEETGKNSAVPIYLVLRVSDYIKKIAN